MSGQILGITSTQWLGALILLGILALLILWRRTKADRLKSFLIANAPKDTVLLHQYGPKSLTVPSISPFVMKLETYLRVAKIPYENQYSRKPGPKGKLPWIQYNDVAVPDSQMCIQFLNVERQVELNKKLKPDQLAIGHLIRRTVEESLYWTLLTWRLVFEPTGLIYKKLGLPSLIVWYMRRAAKPRLWSHGISRHSQAEVTQIMEDDLSAVAELLGDRKFLFGDNVSDVTEFDCALFGQICHLVWQMPGTPVENIMAEKYPNLVSYCERMKSAFWPDWNERIMYPSGLPGDSKTTPEVSEKSITSSSNSALKTSSGKPTNATTNGKFADDIKGNLVTSVNGTTTSVTSSYSVRQVHKENQVVTSRTTSKVNASALLQDKSTLVSAP